MFYDGEGNVRAAGAEAENAGIEDQAEDEGWTKGELYVSPYHFTHNPIDIHVTPSQGSS